MSLKTSINLNFGKNETAFTNGWLKHINTEVKWSSKGSALISEAIDGLRSRYLISEPKFFWLKKIFVIRDLLMIYLSAFFLRAVLTSSAYHL